MGGRHDSLGRDEVGGGAGFDHWRVNSAEQAGNRPHSTAATPAGLALLDAALGASTRAVGTLGFVGRHVGAVTRPVVGAMLRPPFVPEVYQPWTWVAGLARHGERRRDDVMREFSRTLDALVPVVVTAALDRLDLTELVRERVDLDALVAGVDIAAVLDRLDLTELVRERVDLDALVAGVDIAAVLDRLDLTELVRARVDLDALVAGVDIAAVLDRLDLTELVRARVDLDALVAGVDIAAVLDRLDLTELVRARVDLDALVAGVDIAAVLDRLDLTELVRARVNLDAVVAGVNLEAIIRRIDLVGLAEEVIAEVDLPEIIRESTGSVASDTIRGVRMQGISGDEALTRAVHRLRLRRGRRDTGTMGPEPPPPAGPEGSAGPDGSPQQPGVTTRQP